MTSTRARRALGMLVLMGSVGLGAVTPGRAQPAAPGMVRVDDFFMDVHPVTNAEFLAFVRAYPEWRRSRVAALFADDAYLRHWAGDLELGPDAPASSPVVHVSWFAARAYLAAQGKRLPTVAEWEYAARASARTRNASADPVFKAQVLAWASRPMPSPLPAVQKAAANVYGVRGLHDLVREWTEDFNGVLDTGESRDGGLIDRSLFCGAGALGGADVTDYAAFMRDAFRASLQARYALGHLGFRGVRSVGVAPQPARPANPQLERPAFRPADEPSADLKVGRSIGTGTNAVRSTRTDAPSIYALDIDLVDQDGRTLTLAAFRGRPVVATMLYTTCASVCPMVTSEMKKIERQLPDRLRGAVTFAAFSLDPGRDTPSALQAFAAAHALDPARWRLLAASPDDVRLLSVALGVNYAPAGVGGGDIAHSAAIVVIDPGGVVQFRQIGLNRDPRPLLAALDAAAR